MVGRTSPRHQRYKAPESIPPESQNAYYEAGWTDSWSHRRCLHQHRTLLEAAGCAAPHGAVEDGSPRQLKEPEDKVVNEFRFGTKH